MIFNCASPFRQTQNLGVVEHKRLALFLGSVDGARPSSVARVNNFALLVSQRFFQNRLRLVPAEQRLEYHVFVRIGCAFYHHFPQTPCCADPHDARETALGVDGKHHAGARLVRAHHLLHAGGERDFEMIELFLLAVTDRPIGEKRRVTFAARIDDRVLARNVEIGFLLSGETCLG